MKQSDEVVEDDCTDAIDGEVSRDKMIYLIQQELTCHLHCVGFLIVMISNRTTQQVTQDSYWT